LKDLLGKKRIVWQRVYQALELFHVRFVVLLLKVVGVIWWNLNNIWTLNIQRRLLFL